MEQVAFIVWRESVEALLVVMLALVLLGISSWLSSEGQEWFQAIMALVACALVVQMVYWMRRHGRTLKRELENGATRELAQSNWWGLLALVMIAVAREGSETVVFLYGMVAAGADSGHGWRLALAGLLGFLAALASFWILQLGGRLITWRRFFKLTEILLLLLAGSLLVSGMDHLISLDVLPTLIDPVWDSSWLLSADAGLGKVLADFAGYRAYPALSQVLIWVAYWVAAWAVLRRASTLAGRASRPLSTVSA